MTIKETVEKIKNRELSALELTQSYLKNIREKNSDLNIYLEVFSDAEKEAKKIDEQIAKGNQVGMLAGVPFAIKDNLLIKGKKVSAGSKILGDYKATYDATVIKKLREAGAVFLGRVNMDEFAMGSSTENSAFGVTKNPRDESRVPGGSSGGSAAAVSGDLTLAAIGSDTGGSIRQPASFCGVVGLKPTYGSVSRHGLIAMASSLDQIGPLANTVEDTEIIFNCLQGEDIFDSTSVKTKNKDENLKSQKLRIGILDYDKEGVDDKVVELIEQAAKLLKESGHELVKIKLPNIEYSLPCYYIIMPAESSSNLARFDGVRYGLSNKKLSANQQEGNLTEDYKETRGAGFGKEVKKRIMLGTFVLSAGYYDAYYNKAQKARQQIKNDFAKAFNLSENGVDAIILPTTPTPAFKIGEKSSDPLAMYMEDIFTVSANIAGIPAISIPVGSVEKEGKKLPVGLQILAPHFREDILFSIGKEFEKLIS